MRKKEAEQGPHVWSECLEEGIRPLVMYLRENGINTECSCAHRMSVQCQYIPDGEVQHLHNLVFNWLHNHGRPINFEINVHHRVENGHAYTGVDVSLERLEEQDES